MRLTAFALLLTLALTTTINVECARGRQRIDCSKFKKLPPGEVRICYSMYAPICGSDGRTYTNDCTFCDKVMKTDNKLKFVHFGKC
ncbi:serine peptidase inhibitor Kazal type 9 [Phyllostomus discolor]|uniref:Serine peptidase inhibitor Kazal type 9 n=1 Tax=Phyllostomus discolor TaxID=89673 RepID=A0A6J2MYS0_9CHIR|nr:serine protease inhibitor Kazal-type 9 [Phyllostomus discolor]KAF6083103.1 serine peptidase inhibitor Kazal type 9 [Phyllostomus discolor]